MLFKRVNIIDSTERRTCVTRRMKILFKNIGTEINDLVYVLKCTSEVASSFVSSCDTALA